MRVRTNARRSAIVAAAWAAFKENGFARTTMVDISARAAASTATLYGYFKSKDELFAAALEQALEEPSEEAFVALAQPGQLEARLLRFARAHMAVRLSADMLAVDRIVIAEGERSNLFDVLRAKSHMRRRLIADVLQIEMTQGRLRQADPLRAAIHLLALIEFDVRDRRLYGDAAATPAVVEEHVRAGVDAFLHAYAPDCR